jgi:hypothetical protein
MLAVVAVEFYLQVVNQVVLLGQAVVLEIQVSVMVETELQTEVLAAAVQEDLLVLDREVGLVVVEVQVL